MIENGKIVYVHYTGRLDTGEIFDSSEGKDPLTFQIGSGQIIPGFENSLLDKNIGDEFTIQIPSDDAYGPIREDLFLKVDKEKMPGEVEVGQTLQAQADNGQEINVLIKEVNEDHVIIDGNHPLAGKNLDFTISVIDIK